MSLENRHKGPPQGKDTNHSTHIGGVPKKGGAPPELLAGERTCLYLEEGGNRELFHASQKGGGEYCRGKDKLRPLFYKEGSPLEGPGPLAVWKMTDILLRGFRQEKTGKQLILHNRLHH